MPGSYHYVVVPPDGGWGWVVMVVAFLSNFVIDGIMYSFGVFIEALCSEFDKLPGQITLIGSLSGTFYYILGVVFHITVPTIDNHDFNSVGNCLIFFFRFCNSLAK